VSYTNDLYEALSAKNGPLFWKCWRSKFDIRPTCQQVDGYVEPEDIANNFARYFANIYAPNNEQCADSLYYEYKALHENYFGFPIPSLLLMLN